MGESEAAKTSMEFSTLNRLFKIGWNKSIPGGAEIWLDGDPHQAVNFQNIWQSYEGFLRPKWCFCLFPVFIAWLIRVREVLDMRTCHDWKNNDSDRGKALDFECPPWPHSRPLVNHDDACNLSVPTFGKCFDMGIDHVWKSGYNAPKSKCWWKVVYITTNFVPPYFQRNPQIESWILQWKTDFSCSCLLMPFCLPYEKWVKWWAFNTLMPPVSRFLFPIIDEHDPYDPFQWMSKGTAVGCPFCTGPSGWNEWCRD